MTLLAILDLVGGALVALVGVGVVVVGVASSDRSDVMVTLLVATFYLALGLVQIATGIGLWRLRSWGRVLQIAMSCLGLLGIPCGTVISILILVYMFKPGIKILFSERRADELTPAETSEVARALQSSTGTVVIVVSLMMLLGVAMIGMIAAIAIPSLLRARVAANESVTLGRLRAVFSAEVAYSRGNGGYSDTPQCLKVPSSCIPGLGTAAPFLDDATVFDTPSQGYVLHFHPGQAAPAGVVAAGQVSPSSLESFAITAAPAVPMRTGMRYFCADNTGRICSAEGPIDPGALGTCPATCRDLR